MFGHIVLQGIARVACSAHLTRQVAHDGEGGHVQSNPRSGCKLGFVDLAPAANNISGTTAGLDDNCKEKSLSVFVRVAPATPPHLHGDNINSAVIYRKRSME